MLRTGPASLLVAVSLLLVGCGGSGESCSDVGRLDSRLKSMSPSDPDYNDVVVELKQARADCNAH